MKVIAPMPGCLPVTDCVSLRVSETDPVIARQLVREASAACDRAKALADARVAALLLTRSDIGFPVLERKRLRQMRTRAEFKSRRMTTRGTVPKLNLHPQLAGLSRKQYTTQLHRLRRQRFYAQGLTCRGTKRVIIRIDRP